MMLVGYTVCSKYDKNLLFVAVIKALVTGYKEIYSPTEAYYAIELTGPKVGSSYISNIDQPYLHRHFCKQNKEVLTRALMHY